MAATIASIWAVATTREPKGEVEASGEVSTASACSAMGERQVSVNRQRRAPLCRTPRAKVRSSLW
jgi:hypothetical protein